MIGRGSVADQQSGWFLGWGICDMVGSRSWGSAKRLVKGQIFAKIQEFILVSVLKKAVLKLAGLFSPVGAVVQLVLTLWDVFQALREQFSRLMGVVTSVVEALGEIVAGRIDPAKQKIEDVLAALIPVAIGLFARLVGLGGLGRKVQEFIEAIRGRIERAVRRLILKIKARVQRMMRRRRGRRGGDRDTQNARPDGAHGETSPEDERTHRRFAGEAKAVLEAPPEQSGDVIDFAGLMRQKRAEADRLEQRYDRRLENPVRMTIAIDQSQAVRERQIIPFEVRVAPNDTVMDGVMGSDAMVVNLLMHLRAVEHTAQTIDPGLEAGLSAAAAPAPSTRLPETLDNVFVARTTLKPVFDERSTVGRQLVSELVKIHVIRKVGDLEVGKRFKDGGQKTPFYTMLRTDISAGLLDQRVRHPVLLHEVLEKTMPGIPSGARDALEGWLEEA